MAFSKQVRSLGLKFISQIDNNLPLVLWRCWVWRQEGHPACKNWVVSYGHHYLSGARCKWFAYGPADATATPSSLAPVKSRMVYLPGANFPKLSWKEGHKMDEVANINNLQVKWIKGLSTLGWEQRRDISPLCHFLVLSHQNSMSSVYTLTDSSVG